MSQEKGKKNFLECFEYEIFFFLSGILAKSSIDGRRRTYTTHGRKRKRGSSLQLGVVMTGHGAYAAACVGVLREMERRGIQLGAVCGMHAGAWPAALFASGMSLQEMEKALHQAASMGRRMIAPRWYERYGPVYMSEGARVNRLLAVQTGHQVLSLSPGAAIFPMRMLRTGQRVVFSTRGFMTEGDAMLSIQAGLGFAARAAMGAAPFLSPVQYLGSALASDTDLAFACRQLMRLGMQRVLVIRPCACARRIPDALDLAAGALDLAAQQTLDGETGMLKITMPEHVGALSLNMLAQCARAGEEAAAQQMDQILDRLGMARCRVLAFKKRYS